jgi:1-acyl-sn-glycerol-3-phosphate acyltransferase
MTKAPFDATPPHRTAFNTPVLGTLLRWIAIAFLWVTRWRTEVELPEDTRWLGILAPHTSYWDFFVLVGAAIKHRVDVRWLGKHTLFRGPFGPLFRWLGGIPVNPTRSGEGRVPQVIDVFEHADELRLAISPEAGLRKVARWRSGFYHIAVGADVPLVLVFIDFATRTAGATEHFRLSGDVEADYQRIRDFYRPLRGRNPERFSLPETPAS